MFEVFSSFAFLVVFGLGAWLVFGYNRLVKDRNLLKEGWSGIDVQLKRRANLVPNLVEIVKEFAKHEKTTLERVTKCRSESLNAGGVGERVDAENNLTGAIGGLFALVEDYPELQASNNFTQLHQELSDIEDQIQMSRRYYNGTVRNYNIRVESFPSLIIARLFGFKLAEYFQVETTFSRTAPEVDI